MSGLRWIARDREWCCGTRTLVMGVLNVTPDSFSDGGRYDDPASAIAHGLALDADGADILDIGGESTRPGAAPVSCDEELRRVLPVIRGLSGRVRCALSIDTTKAAVAEAALLAGAHIVNDVSAGTVDPELLAVAARHRAGVVLMHMQGRPGTMQQQPAYRDVVAEVAAFLAERMEAARAAGLTLDQLAVDPGICFGKSLEHNLDLLRGLTQLAALGRPVLVGLSRKSFLGRLTGLEVADRLAPGLAALSFAILQGAHIVRVHDVKESCAAVRVLDSLRAQHGCKCLPT